MPNVPGKKVVIHSKRRVFEDFFSVDEVSVSFEGRDGSLIGPVRRLSFERGDSDAVPGARGGMASEGEDIRIVEYGIDDFFEKPAGGFFQDPKIIIAGLWLKLRSDKTAGNLETRGGTT